MRLRPDRFSADRDEFLDRLAEQGIGTSVHYIPLHMMPYYRQRYGHSPEDFPQALAAYRSAFSLPIYPDLSDEQVQRVIRTVIDTGESLLKGRGLRDGCEHRVSGGDEEGNRSYGG
jgi:dTDP-4-amino-4,6-dideoxygalactose transaminase